MVSLLLLHPGSIMNAAALFGCLVLYLLFRCGELNMPVSAEMSYRQFIIDNQLLSSRLMQLARMDLAVWRTMESRAHEDCRRRVGKDI